MRPCFSDNNNAWQLKYMSLLQLSWKIPQKLSVHFDGSWFVESSAQVEGLGLKTIWTQSKKGWQLTLPREMRGRGDLGRRGGRLLDREGQNAFYLAHARWYFPNISPIMLDDIQVGPLGARVGRPAVLQARPLLCKSGKFPKVLLGAKRYWSSPKYLVSQTVTVS